MRAGASPGAMIGERKRLLGALVSAALVLVAAILAFAGGGGTDAPAVGQPQLVTRAGLVAAEDARGEPIYWAGERPPLQIELTTEANGSAYVRYVPATDAGHRRHGPLTVATYRVADAETALRTAALASEVDLIEVGDGLAFVPPGPDRSAYIVFPDSEQQIEVYDPAPGRAPRLAASGKIRPVGESR